MPGKHKGRRWFKVVDGVATEMKEAPAVTGSCPVDCVRAKSAEQALTKYTSLFLGVPDKIVV
jgi:hypothetical protein